MPSRRSSGRTTAHPKPHYAHETPADDDDSADEVQVQSALVHAPHAHPTTADPLAPTDSPATKTKTTTGLEQQQIGQHTLLANTNSDDHQLMAILAHMSKQSPSKPSSHLSAQSVPHSPSASSSHAHGLPGAIPAPLAPIQFVPPPPPRASSTSVSQQPSPAPSAPASAVEADHESAKKGKGRAKGKGKGRTGGRMEDDEREDDERDEDDEGKSFSASASASASGVGEGAGAGAGAGGGNGSMNASGRDEDTTRTRKDNHKEVERRRRETINSGISSLALLIPGSSKNKGSILSRAVEYIHQLQSSESRNIEKWTLEKLLSDQVMDGLRKEVEMFRNHCGVVEGENEELRRENEGLRRRVEGKRGAEEEGREEEGKRARME